VLAYFGGIMANVIAYAFGEEMRREFVWFACNQIGPGNQVDTWRLERRFRQQIVASKL